MPFYTNLFGLGKRPWNLETSSALIEFPYLLHFFIGSFSLQIHYNLATIISTKFMSFVSGSQMSKFPAYERVLLRDGGKYFDLFTN